MVGLSIIYRASIVQSLTAMELPLSVERYMEYCRAIREFYNQTLGFNPFQFMFGKDMIFNLMAIIKWCVVTARKQQQVDIDNSCK